MVVFQHRTASGGNFLSTLWNSALISHIYCAICHSGRRLLAASSVPALLCCCTGSFTAEEAVRIRLHAPGGQPSGCLDIFYFNDDSLGRLDAYQRIDRYRNEGEITGLSTRGGKRMVILANSADDRYTWADINAYEGLMGLVCELKNEDPAFPVMSGQRRLLAGEESRIDVTLSPVLSEIVVVSLSCDFHGKPYEGAQLEDIRIYLTNVNSRCSPFCEQVPLPGGIVNEAGLREEELRTFRHPQMLLACWPEPVGETVVFPDLHFYCYPNQAVREGFGTPFTRLVIEGKLGGETWYWPLNLNRQEDGGGIARNRSYRLDITLTQRGVKDPDTPIEGVAAKLELQMENWVECPPVYIPF